MTAPESNAFTQLAERLPAAGRLTMTFLGKTDGDRTWHYEFDDTRRGRARRDAVRVRPAREGGLVVEQWSGTQWREMVVYRSTDLARLPRTGLEDMPESRSQEGRAAFHAWACVYGRATS